MDYAWILDVSSPVALDTQFGIHVWTLPTIIDLCNQNTMPIIFKYKGNVSERFSLPKNTLLFLETGCNQTFLANTLRSQLECNVTWRITPDVLSF